jgi:brefeldin A-inhibited guanine nucleotide-exchange protein
VTSAFDIVSRLNKQHFPDVVSHGFFADFTVCVTDFCKVSKFQKISLLAISMLQNVIPTMLRTPECGFVPIETGAEPAAAHTADDPMIKSWYPILFSFYDIIMNGEDLEVRRL